MTALGWILLTVGPLGVVFTFPVSWRRLGSQVALTIARTDVRFVGVEGRP